MKKILFSIFVLINMILFINSETIATGTIIYELHEGYHYLSGYYDDEGTFQAYDPNNPGYNVVFVDSNTGVLFTFTAPVGGVYNFDILSNLLITAYYDQTEINNFIITDANSAEYITQFNKVYNDTRQLSANCYLHKGQQVQFYIGESQSGSSTSTCWYVNAVLTEADANNFVEYELYEGYHYLSGYYDDEGTFQSYDPNNPGFNVVFVDGYTDVLFSFTATQNGYYKFEISSNLLISSWYSKSEINNFVIYEANSGENLAKFSNTEINPPYYTQLSASCYLYEGQQVEFYLIRSGSENTTCWYVNVLQTTEPEIILLTNENQDVNSFTNIFGSLFTLLNSYEDETAILNNQLYAEKNYNLYITADSTVNGDVTVNLPDGFSFDFDQVVTENQFSISNGYCEKIVIYPSYYEKINADSTLLFTVTGVINQQLEIPVQTYPYEGSINANEYSVYEIILNPKTDFRSTSVGIYNNRLALMSGVLSFASYTEHIIIDSLHNLGYFEIQTFGYDTDDGIAGAIGMRNLIEGDQIIHQIAVVVRGTTGFNEWMENFKVFGQDNENYHDSFVSCAQTIHSWVNSYFLSHNLSVSNSRLYVTGHSRGGAAVDIYMHDYVNQEGITGTAYTFAAPNSTKSPAYDTNIFNIINVNDLVPYVPAGDGWGKYGQNIIFGTPESLPNMKELISNMIFLGDLGNVIASLPMMQLPTAFTLAGLAVYQKCLLDIYPNHMDSIYLNNIPSSKVSSISWEEAVSYHKSEIKQKIDHINDSLKNALKTGFSTIQKAEMSYLYHLLNGKKEFLLEIDCPVNTKILDHNGTVIVSFENHVLQNVNTSKVLAFSEGESDFIILPADEEFQVTITAVSNGTMDIQMAKLSETFDLESKNIQKNISIAKATNYSLSYEPGTNLEEIHLYEPAKSIEIIDMEDGSLIIDVDAETVSYQLSAKVLPETACQKVKWTSSMTSVATVDENGLVTAKKGDIVGVMEGWTYITATTTDGTNISSERVKITLGRKVKKGSLYFTNDDNKMAVGKSIMLTAAFNQEKQPNNQEVIWSSDNEKIAKVSSKGLIGYVQGKSVGSTTIKVCSKENNSICASKTVFVYPLATDVFITDADQNDLIIDLGTKGTDNEKLTYQLDFVVGPSEAMQYVTWKSSSNEIASVDKNGLVTGKKIGAVTITATATDGSNKSCSVKLQIKALPQPGSLKINGNNKVSKNKTLKLNAVFNQVIQPENGNIIWKSSDSSIAAVNSDGIVTGYNIGKAIITACSDEINNICDTKELFVYHGPDAKGFSIWWKNDNGEFETGKTVEIDAAAGEKLTLYTYDANGEVNADWKNGSAKVVKMSSAGGVSVDLTALKTGNAKITASHKDGKKTVSASVTVKVVAKVLPGNILISGPESVAAGKTAKFTAKIGSQTPAPSVKAIVWETSDTSKAAVNNSGVVTGKAATTTPVEIRACAKDSLVNGKYTNCVSASLNVVTAAASVTIEVINGTTTLDAGEIVTLKAVVSPAGASQKVTWTGKSSKVADVTINDDGTVTVKGKAKGSVSIKAVTTDGTKKSASIKLTVGVKVKEGMLSIKGEKDTLAVKKSMKLSAVFKPVPSNKKVEWSILEGADLITLKNGTVKAIAPGHAIVQVCSVENPSVCKTAKFDVISPVTSVKFTEKKAKTLDIGGGSEPLPLEAKVLPANATKPELEWKSSKPNVASVDENGVVTPKSVGSTVITAAATDGSKKSAKLTVKVVSKVQDGSLTIEGDTHELSLKKTTTLMVKFTQENAPTNQKVTWKSSAPKTASVSAKGVVKGLKEGTATITATSVDNKTVTSTWDITVGVSVKSDEIPQETALPDIEALVEALLAETETVEETEETITETAEPTAVETEKPDTDETEIVQTPEAVEEIAEGEDIAADATAEPEESYEEEPVIVDIIETEDEIAVAYESEDADSLMTEESESGLDFGESLFDAEGVDVVIRDFGEYDALSGETGGVISLARERFELTDDLYSSLVFTVEDESVAKLTEQSVDTGIELQLLTPGETKLIIKQDASGEVLREIRLVVTAAPLPEEPIEEELPSEELLTESVEVLESGEPTVDEESILVEVDAELVFSIAPEE